MALTHWGRVTHICVGKLTIIGSGNGLSPERRQAIIWTNAGILLIGPLGTNFSEILIEIQTFSLKKISLKMSSAKCCSFRLALNVLSHYMNVCWLTINRILRQISNEVIKRSDLKKSKITSKSIRGEGFKGYRDNISYPVVIAVKLLLYNDHDTNFESIAVYFCPYLTSQVAQFSGVSWIHRIWWRVFFWFRHFIWSKILTEILYWIFI